MSLINELREKSNKVDMTKQEVITEIKTYFDEYLDSDVFEQWLKRNISEEEIEKREAHFKVDFWETHEGCSNTYFYCGGKKWNNPEDIQSHYYRKVKLYDIHNEICEYLGTKLIEKMIDLGFKYLRQEKRKSRFEYFKTIYYFGW